MLADVLTCPQTCIPTRIQDHGNVLTDLKLYKQNLDCHQIKDPKRCQKQEVYADTFNMQLMALVTIHASTLAELHCCVLQCCTVENIGQLHWRCSNKFAGAL